MTDACASIKNAASDSKSRNENAISYTVGLEYDVDEAHVCMLLLVVRPFRYLPLGVGEGVFTDPKDLTVL